MSDKTRALVEVQLVTSGAVSADDLEHAREVVLDAVDAVVDGPGTEPQTAASVASAASARVTLSVVADPDLPRPALAQVTTRLGGRRVRAQAAAAHLREAVDLMADRLALRLTDRRAS